MPAWKNIRRFWSAVAAQGVVDPGPVDLLGPVQAVQILDDLSERAIQRVDVASSFWDVTSPAAGVGRHSVIAIAAGPQGTLFGDGRSNTAAQYHVLDIPLATIANLALVANITRFGVRQPTSQVYTGDIAAAVIVAGTPFWRFNTAAQRRSIFLQPGEILTISHSIANTALSNIGFTLVDVP
jgi:hypothetical protein